MQFQQLPVTISEITQAKNGREVKLVTSRCSGNHCTLYPTIRFCTQWDHNFSIVYTVIKNTAFHHVFLFNEIVAKLMITSKVPDFWYSLDSGDRYQAVFFTYLEASLQALTRIQTGALEELGSSVDN